MIMDLDRSKLFFSAFLAITLCACGPGPAPEAPRPAAPPVEAAAAPAPAPAAAEIRFPEERLAGILAQMRAEAAPYGFEVGMDQLRKAAEHRLKELKRGFRESDAKEMALPPPERRPFTEEEKANPGPRAKWLENGAWSYGDHLPRDGAAVSEAWTRIYGSRDMSSGSTLFIQTNVPKDIWLRMKWQPRKLRWSYYTEEEELDGMRNLLNTRYAFIEPDTKNSARFEFRRLQPAVEKARAAGRDPSGYHGTMRAALFRAFDTELEREALRYYLDTPEAR